MTATLKYRIHYEISGEYFWFDLEGETLEEIQSLAIEGVHRRNGENPWSEDLTDDY